MKLDCPLLEINLFLFFNDLFYDKYYIEIFKVYIESVWI
jgi:hypothetical protein